MASNLKRGGIITNLDKPEIDPVARRDAEVEEHADAILTEAIADAKKHGSDTFKVGTLNEFENRGLNVDVTFDEQKKTERELAQSAWVGQPALVIDPSVPEGFSWRFGDDRKVEAIHEGRFCPNCLQPQKNILDPKCEWAHGKSNEVTGCGYSGLTDEVLPWDMPG